MKSVQKTVKPEKQVEQDYQISTDIVRLLDLLARIEIRRQAKQRSTDKDKVS